MAKEISVYRIDYEMRDKEEGESKLWSAAIAAYGQEEALKYLGKFLGRTFKTLQIGRECSLNAITNEVVDNFGPEIRNRIISKYLEENANKPEEKPLGKKVTAKKEEEKKEETKKVTPRGKSITKK
jgi:hypothetical protein